MKSISKTSLVLFHVAVVAAVLLSALAYWRYTGMFALNSFHPRYMTINFLTLVFGVLMLALVGAAIADKLSQLLFTVKGDENGHAGIQH